MNTPGCPLLVAVRPRDVAAVAWRLALEFARKRRPVVGPDRPLLAAALWPALAFTAVGPGAVHRDRQAVMVLRPASNHRSLVAPLVALGASVVVGLLAQLDLRWLLAAVPLFVVGASAGLLLVSQGARRYKSRKRKVAPPVTVPRPVGGWVLHTAAAAPAVTDAIGTLFKPYLAARIPGQTVLVKAANHDLVNLYRKSNLVSVAGSALELTATLPGAQGTECRTSGVHGHPDDRPRSSAPRDGGH